MDGDGHVPWRRHSTNVLATLRGLVGASTVTVGPRHVWLETGGIHMVTNVLRFVSVLLTAIGLAGGFAHLLALPNKIDLGPADYLTVQQIYRGWALLGVPIILALVTTIALAVAVRRDTSAFRWTLAAAVCIAAALLAFLVFTYPANQATANWTMLPANWQVLRREWEYSHAAGAVLYLLALSALTLSLLGRRT